MSKNGVTIPIKPMMLEQLMKRQVKNRQPKLPLILVPADKVSRKEP